MTEKEIEYIKTSLPSAIVRAGSPRLLKYGFYNEKYHIWYGTIISGNYVAEHVSLIVAVERMKEYVEKYKDMDEVTFMNLGLKRKICLHCKVPLILDKDKYSYCPECRLCYIPHGFFFKLYLKLWRLWLRRQINGS